MVDRMARRWAHQMVYWMARRKARQKVHRMVPRHSWMARPTADRMARRWAHQKERYWAPGTSDYQQVAELE